MSEEDQDPENTTEARQPDRGRRTLPAVCPPGKDTPGNGGKTRYVQLFAGLDPQLRYGTTLRRPGIFARIA